MKLNVSVVGQLKKFGLLGVLWENMAEREGFEPPGRGTPNGFQDRRFRPLSHLSD